MPTNQAEVPTLRLNDLSAGTPGLTAHMAGALVQAASVCLEDQGHATGAIMRVDGAHDARFALEWDAATSQMQCCYADPDEATEFGACGIAALLVQKLADLTIVARSRRGTGFDYWLGHRDDELLFQGKARLEVSGIRKGTDAGVAAREQQKLKQVERYQPASPTPAVIVIVEFGAPRSRVANK